VTEGDGNPKLRAYYDANAWTYDRWMSSYDRVMLGESRARLCGHASGRILELGVGTGLNLPQYAFGIDVTGLDLSAEMLARARQRTDIVAHVDLLNGDAHQLPFRDGTFDTVLTTLFLSSVPDPRRAVEEAYRVLRSDGRLLCIDHVRSSLPPVRWLQRLTADLLVDRTGVDLRRDPMDHLAAVGFVVEHEQRSRLGVIQAFVARRRD
jgi:ubiquinone/menaquinone biosynthesis C-methylase UbiE